MEIGGKILTGAAVTALLAVAGHYATGDGFISGLEHAAQTEMTAQGMDGVTVTFSHDPLSRKALLDGDVSNDVKLSAMNAVSDIPGISSAHWVSDDIARTGPDRSSKQINGGPAVDPAIDAAVKDCQSGVDKVIENKKLSFRSGSAYISPASNKILDEVAAALKPCSGLAIAVGGHTDDAGNAEVNRIMSQERADRVRAGLMERGIPENLITATGYGAQQPLATGSGPEADAQNRRIEFKLSATNGLAANEKETNDANSQQGE